MTGTFTVSPAGVFIEGGLPVGGDVPGPRRSRVRGLAYSGILPPGDGSGWVIPARYPGGSDQVYALHGSHTWVFDLLITLAISTAVGAALWISPLGAGARNPEGFRGRGGPA